MLFLGLRWGFNGLEMRLVTVIVVSGTFSVGSIWFAEDLAEAFCNEQDWVFYFLDWIALIFSGIALALCAYYVPGTRR